LILAAESPLDTFRSVLTGTSRALAEQPEVEVAWTSDQASQTGKLMRVPMPGRALPADQVAQARGAADPWRCACAITTKPAQCRGAGRNARARLLRRGGAGALRSAWL
jgi:cobalamin biosynthesis protein CobT